MPCYNPVQAYKSWNPGPDSKYDIKFTESKMVGPFHQISLPCGQCIGCKLRKSQEWAARCYHESRLHGEENCMFLTLTYNDEQLPSEYVEKIQRSTYQWEWDHNTEKFEDPSEIEHVTRPHGSLKLRDFQLFMKKLRKHAWETEKKKLRFFHCGEYGTKFQRPHYHVCIFGYRLPNLTLWKFSKTIPLYRSEILEKKLWTNHEKKSLGFSTVGEVTYESTAYVARYILKKIYGKPAKDHYAVTDLENSTLLGYRKPEYTTMSRRPGIGAEFLKKYPLDFYLQDQMIIKGLKLRPPRYYDHLYEIINPEEMKQIKIDRIRRTLANKEDNTPERLKTKMAVVMDRLNKHKQLERDLK